MPIRVNDNLKRKNGVIKNRISAISKKTVSEVTDVFYGKVLDNITLSRHSKKEFKRLGHPFALKHGTYQDHGHEPIWGIHQDLGFMLLGLKKDVEVVGNRVFGFVGWRENVSDEVRHVIFGSVKMIPRPVLQLTANSIGLNKILIKALKDNSKDLKNGK